MPVFGDMFCKAVERFFYVIYVPEAIHMIIIDIQDDGNMGVEFKKTSRIFVGFGHEIFAAADPDISAYGGKFASDMDGRIEPFFQHNQR